MSRSDLPFLRDTSNNVFHDKVATMTSAPKSPPPRQQPVLSLLDKYSTLHNDIEQAREETSACQTKIQDAETRIAKLLETRELMLVQERAAIEQRQQLLQETENDLQESLKLEKEHEQAQSTKQKAKASLELEQQQIRQYRQNFLESSRAFRESCRQLCIQGEAAGMNPLLHYSKVKNQPELLQAFQQEAQEPNEEDKLYESEMKDLEERLERQTKSCEAVREERDTLLARKEELAEKAEKQKSQQSKLQAQLDRILKDISDLNGQIGDTRRETEEAREMAANFEKDVKRRRLDARSRQDAVTTAPHSVTPTPGLRIPTQRPMLARNPYAKAVSTQPDRSGTAANSHVTTSIESNLGNNRTQASAARVATAQEPDPVPPPQRRQKPANTPRQFPQQRPRPGQPLSVRQYPHRVGKVRSSRDFGLSLRLSDNSRGAAAVTTPSPASIPVPTVTPASNAPTTNQRFALQSSNETSLPRHQTKKKHHRPFIGDEDEDDDDDLLSFVAFGKTV